jgi:outer membrane protein
MFRKITLITLAVVFLTLSARSQEAWSLERCVNYARQNSLTVKQARYDVAQAELTEKLNKFSRLPNLNANLSGGWNFGKNINPTTNQFDSDQSFNGNGSVSSGVILFDGFRINNSIKQSKLDVQAARLDAEAAVNDISLLVAQAYLSILLAEEQLDNAHTRLQLSQQQLDQTNKQIAAGVLPENNRLDFEAQVALDQQTIVEAENQVETNYLTLKQLMEIDPNTDIRIETPEVIIPDDVDPDIYQTNEVFAAALQTQPQIEAGLLRHESAALQEKIARSGIMPQISVGANINTRYSSLATDPAKADFSDAKLVPEDMATPAIINGERTDITFFNLQGVEVPDMTFFDQLNNFLGQNVGFQVSVPLYNNHTNKIAMERAKINALNQEVVNRQIRQQLKTDVQRAVADAKAAKRSMEAARRSIDAAQAAFENAQKRYDLGAINSLEFTTARNNLDQAQIQLTQSRYQYLFNLKVVDFYLGRELRLD